MLIVVGDINLFELKDICMCSVVVLRSADIPDALRRTAAGQSEAMLYLQQHKVL